jgi:hypothetical protein
VTDYRHRSLVELAKSIEQMSGGRLKIEALSVGSVVGFFEVLDGKNSAAGLFGSPLGGPFGTGQAEVPLVGDRARDVPAHVRIHAELPPAAHVPRADHQPLEVGGAAALPASHRAPGGAGRDHAPGRVHRRPGQPGRRGAGQARRQDLQTPDEILRAELDAPKTVAHAQKMTPPMEIAVRHYWQKK